MSSVLTSILSEGYLYESGTIWRSDALIRGPRSDKSNFRPRRRRHRPSRLDTARPRADRVAHPHVACVAAG